MPNMPNQMMNRMQVPQGTSLLSELQYQAPPPYVLLLETVRVLKFAKTFEFLLGFKFLVHQRLFIQLKSECICLNCNVEASMFRTSVVPSGHGILNYSSHLE